MAVELNVIGIQIQFYKIELRAAAGRQGQIWKNCVEFHAKKSTKLHCSLVKVGFDAKNQPCQSGKSFGTFPKKLSPGFKGIKLSQP